MGFIEAYQKYFGEIIEPDFEAFLEQLDEHHICSENFEDALADGFKHFVFAETSPRGIADTQIFEIFCKKNKGPYHACTVYETIGGKTKGISFVAFKDVKSANNLANIRLGVYTKSGTHSSVGMEELQEGRKDYIEIIQLNCVIFHAGTITAQAASKPAIAPPPFRLE